ncbi:hypothetical protein E8E11_005885 [Didymella keratinophila]|nr:hypothetical protein E8E11_005885 [Didymella keratinophila]
MSDPWFASKIALNSDTNDNEGGCDPREARALKAYLRHKTTASEAARAMTRPVSNAANPKGELHHLWGLFQDAFIELPQSNVVPLIALMQAIEDLSNPVVVPNESGHPDDGFWKKSPGFANLWADMYPRYCFRANVDGSAGELREVMRTDHTRQAHIEAQLVYAGLAGLTIHWGYEIVADALESSDAIIDFEVLAAVEWLVTSGTSLGMMKTHKMRMMRNHPIKVVDVDEALRESAEQAPGGQQPGDQDGWINDLASYLGVHEVFIPIGLYTKEKLVWLNNNLTNSVDIDSRLQQAKKLQQWRSSGNPYRRGYLLYGPPGTGKTSLAQAVASEYDLELFEIKLPKMTDAKLQSTFKDLRSRCVVLVEDIDAAGIGREDLVQAEKESKEKQKTTKAPNDGWATRWRKKLSRTIPRPIFERTTLKLRPNTPLLVSADSSMFLTVQAQRRVLLLSGRMDQVIYMGYSCPGSAAATFKRIFGTDLTFHVPEDKFERLAERFAKKIPKDMFTPCEIVDYCLRRSRIEGKDEYLYDIKDDAQEGKVQDEDAEDKQAKIKRQLAALPPDEPYPESDGEDDVYVRLEEVKKLLSPEADGAPSTPLKVAGSPDRSSFLSEENFAPRLADPLRTNGENDWMFEDGHYPPEWAYKGWMGL